MIHAYLHGGVDSVFCVVLVMFGMVENSGVFIELQLELGDQSAFVVDNPQGLIFANNNAFDLQEFIPCWLLTRISNELNIYSSMKVYNIPFR